jgi:preprotein translocase subunit SecE
MARDRQRAKQRQAERRQARQAARRAGATPPGDGAAAARPDPDDPREELGADAGPIAGRTGAPPENTGRSDTVAKSPPPAPIIDDEDDLDDVDPELEADAIEAGALGSDEGQVYEDELEPTPARRPRGERADVPGAPTPSGGSRVVHFLRACWAELQRVQWPDRQTLTQLTGIVLFFCVLAGLYLGVLDFIFSELIKAII